MVSEPMGTTTLPAHCNTVGGSEYYVAAMEGAGNGATELELKSTNITTVPDNESEWHSQR